MGITAEHFRETFMALLPKGKLWDGIGEKFRALALVFGREFQRVNDRANDAMLETDPRTADETLDEWETIYELDGTGTIEERQAKLVSRAYVVRSARPVDFQEKLAPVLDLDPADVEVIETTVAQAAIMDDPSQAYNFHIFRDPDLPGTPDLYAAQIEADKMKHAHTRVRVFAKKSFYCDDPDSLCDRDLLGS